MGVYKLKGKNNKETGNFRLCMKIKSKLIQQYSRDYEYLQGLNEALVNLRSKNGTYEDAKLLMASYPVIPELPDRLPQIEPKPPKEPKPVKPKMTDEERKAKKAEYLAKKKAEKVVEDAAFQPYIYIGKTCGNELFSFYLKRKIPRRTQTTLIHFGQDNQKWINYGSRASRENNGKRPLFFDEWLLLSQQFKEIRMEYRDGAFYQAENYVLSNGKYTLAE
jgi:hypothetical protein